MPASRHLAPTLALLLSACGGTSSTNSGADLGVSSGSDLAGMGDPLADLGESAEDLVTPAYYLPTGFKLVPFLADTATYVFDQPTSVLDGSRDYQAVLETGAGRIVIDLLERQTPITVNSFVFLALNHYFDGIAFHRVIPGFVAQGGDPNTLDEDRSQWGRGGPGYFFVNEVVGLTYDRAGVVGMANAGADTNGSQFFITLAAATNLDPDYTIFARVTEGLAALPKIARDPSGDIPPNSPTRMTRVYIVAR